MRGSALHCEFSTLKYHFREGIPNKEHEQADLSKKQTARSNTTLLRAV